MIGCTLTQEHEEHFRARDGHQQCRQNIPKILPESRKSMKRRIDWGDVLSAFEFDQFHDQHRTKELSW